MSVSTMFTTLPGSWDKYMDEYPLWRSNTFFQSVSPTTVSTFTPTTSSWYTSKKTKTDIFPSSTKTEMLPSSTEISESRSSSTFSFYPSSSLSSTSTSTDSTQTVIAASTVTFNSTSSPILTSSGVPSTRHEEKSRIPFTTIGGITGGVVAGLSLIIAARIILIRRKRRSSPKTAQTIISNEPTNPKTQPSVTDAKAEFEAHDTAGRTPFQERAELSGQSIIETSPVAEVSELGGRVIIGSPMILGVTELESPISPVTNASELDGTPRWRN